MARPTLLPVLAAAALALPGTAIGAHPPVVATDTAEVNGRFRFGLPVTCPAGTETGCAGTIRVVTARGINPYSPRDPRRRELVAQSDYAVPAGTSRTVAFRMAGPGMAQLLKTGRLRVRVRVTAVGPDGAVAERRTAVLLTMTG